MYEIILQTWYPETPDVVHQEVYNKYFTTLEAACKFLGENCEQIMDDFPVDSIRIKYNHDVQRI